MRELAAIAHEGDRQAAQRLFLGSETHSLTHDIDKPLREADARLARDLCLSVSAIETALVGSVDTAAIEREANLAADLLAQALGILDRPAGST